MNIILIIIIIALVVIVAVAAIIAVFSLLSGGKKVNEIHFSGGVDVDSGRLSKEKNYFKGFSGVTADTVCMGQQSNQGFYVTLKNITDGSVSSMRFFGELVIGREGDFEVDDKYVSRKHCKLIEDNGTLYLCNLSTSNHTFLNEKTVLDIVPVKSGDKISLGKTKLEIVF